MPVYVDVVAFLNFLVDFLLILAANRLTGFPPDFRRSAAAAALGGLYGGACLIRRFSFLGSLPWRIVSFALMASIAFGWNRSAVQRGGVFVLLSMSLGGITVGFGHSSLPLLMLAVLLMWLLCSISFHGNVGNREFVKVKLCWEDREMQIIALKDTGNTLRDPLTGEQVMVAGADVGEKLLGFTQEQLRRPLETLAESNIKGLRLIPYHAVGQAGSILLAVRIPKALIGTRHTQPLVAFAPEVIAKGELYQMLTGGTV